MEKDAEASLYLIYRDGERPSAMDIRTAIDHIDALSIGTAMLKRRPTEETPAEIGMEFLYNGMSFDLFSAGPDNVPAALHPRYKIGIETDIDPLNHGILEVRLGPHIVSGAHSLAIIRALFIVADHIGQIGTSPFAYGWAPIASLMGPTYFHSVVRQWMGGGAFPAMGLSPLSWQGEASLLSDGLSFFTGQELQLDANIEACEESTRRLGQHLINHVIHHGKFDVTELITAPDGSQLTLEPVNQGTILRVRRAS